VPCDAGGLNACPYWQSHSVSPGAITLTDEEYQAQYYWRRLRVLGWEAAQRFMPPDLPADVLERMYFLETYSRYLQQQLAQQR
jgi:hypothetical protein